MISVLRAALEWVIGMWVIITHFGGSLSQD
jgi:hypothetical protein